ncbi:MAG TPA: twitching motility protein PilT, partial [Roseiflexaceae bacterium]|nr:twitching motility protein PilT [Roseiflexaceae bacterium]
VAGLQGVKVLSLNQLTDAVRPPVLPGQDIEVVIRDVGREREQGISFLDDGTMIVVEDARQLVGRKVSAVVTRIYQTQTGRIVFAHLNNGMHTS